MELYRGFDVKISNGTLENPFLNQPREPIHTDVEVHQIADEWFNENFGIRARSRCIFCSPDIHVAHKYVDASGTLTRIKAIGPHCIIYSEKVEDFNDHTYEFEHTYEGVRDWLELQNYVMVNDASEIAKSFNGEIMLFCEKYKVDVIE